MTDPSTVREDVRPTSPESHFPDELPAEFIRAAQAGDLSAMRALVALYGPRVHRFLWRMCEYKVGGTAVEDLVQDTFLRVHRSLLRFDIAGSAKLSTWIFTIASRLAMTEVKRQTKQKNNVAALKDFGEEQSSGGSNQSMLRQALRQAMNKLSSDQQAIVVLREYEDKSYEEIADILDLDVGTVKSRLHRARNILKAELKEFSHE